MPIPLPLPEPGAGRPATPAPGARCGHRFRLRFLLLSGALLVSALGAGAFAEDWPTYRHDNQRSGWSRETLVFPLERAWTWRSPNPPSPAWGGPARADYYTSTQVPLVPRLAFDRCFDVAAVGQAVYFGSSADDSVYALNARDGSLRWCYTVDAPVRMAPSLAGGRVYFGSDDGRVYCLDGGAGTLVWKYSASGDDNYLVPSDGRFVSPWPVRSGIVVDGGVAYFSAGFFPAEGVYVCALDAATGSDQGAGRYRRLRVNDISLQGYALASPTRLIFPAGRSSPYLFRRSDGLLLGQFAPSNTGSRGTFALLSGSRLITGPSSRGTALLEEFDATSAGQDQIAAHDGGRFMVATATRYYVLNEDSVLALDRASRSPLWRRDLALPDQLIATENALFAGGKDQVSALDVDSGETLWSANVIGRAHGLAVSGGRLYVSTDRGLIYAFRDVSTAPNAFVRGDANGDFGVDIGDAVTILLYLYLGGGFLTCEDHGDVDDNGEVEMADSVALLSYLFLEGPAPRAPFPGAGTDRTADAHSCGDEGG